ncbi:MAG: diguanylate cyclase [Oscillospiraceae bacterium]
MKCRNNVLRILFGMVIAAILAGTLIDFSLQLQRALTDETYATLSEVSKDYNKAFSGSISYNVKTMEVLAGSLAEMQGKTKQDIIRVLSNAASDGGFKKMMVCDFNGVICSDDSEACDISKCDFFREVMRSGTDVSEPIISFVSGEESIIIAIPIHGENENAGFLFGVCPISEAEYRLLDFTYYSEGYGFVVTSDGTIVLSSEHRDKLADEENLFDFFEKTTITDFSVAELKTAIKNGESKSFTYTYNGERRFVSFAPTTVNDWYTLSIASDVMLLKQEKLTNQIVLRLILGLVSVGILLLAWIIAENRHQNKKIRIASHKYQSLLSNINGGMIVAVHATVADETIVTYVSEGFTDMTGYTLEDIREIYDGKYLRVISEKDRKAVFDMYLEQLKSGNNYHMPYRICKKDGSTIWVMDNGYLVEDSDGLRNHSIITDITVIKQQEEELRMSENRFSVAINASSGTLFEVDLKRQLYTHFENAERIFGINAEKLLSDTKAFSTLPYNEFVDAVTKYFFHPDDRATATHAMEELLKTHAASYEARLRRYDNSYIWARIDLSLISDELGLPAFLVGFMSDIDDIKKQSELLENRVQTDPMTGLFNKIAMATLSNKVLSECPNGCHALIVLDIDNFKGINDTLGHAFGDLVLIEVCSKLKTAFRNNDIVGRMGGDEFAVFMKNVPDTSSVLKKATELSAAFRQTYFGEKEDYKISCSIGIFIIEANQDTFETIYRKADAALYQAKRNGKDQFVIYQEKDAASYPIEFARTNDEELQNLKVSNNMEAYIFELMYTSKDFNISINMALAAIGQQYHVSRVSIFENDEKDFTTSNIYEWCNDGVETKMDSMQNMKLLSENESIMDCFDKNGLLYCNDVSELPSYIRKILEFKGVLSTLKVIIANDEKICGFIGFDECKEHRAWTSEEIEKLSFLSKVLSVFLFKKKTETALIENLHTRLKILDILPDYICVVNPNTHALEYSNKKMQELLPAAMPGAFCFNTLHGGQNAPCKTCLIERIKRGDVDNLEIISEDKNLRLGVSAMSIKWANDKDMVLLYGTEEARKIV